MSKLPPEENNQTPASDNQQPDNSVDASADTRYTSASEYIIDAQPGETLKRLRELQGYSVHDVASNLHLSSYYITNIEAGRYDKLPSYVFARGYLRSYATLVGLDPAEIIALFAKHVDSEPSETLLQEAHTQTGSTPSIEVEKKVPLVSYMLLSAIGIVAIAFIGYLVFSRVAVEPEAPTPVQVEPTPPVNSVPATPLVPVTAPSTLAATTTQAPVVEPAVDPATEQSATTGQSLLAFRFTDDCWLEVAQVQPDGSVRYIFSGYKRQGDVLTVTSPLPVNVVFGNADAVSMQLDGKRYNFNRYIARITRVARFTIDAPTS